MNKVASYIIVLAIGVFVCWIFTRGCGKGSGIQIIQDSLRVQKKINDSIKIAAAGVSSSVDSLLAQKAKGDILYSHKIDSLNTVIYALKQKTKVNKDSIVTLYKQLKQFYDNKDTVALLAAYNELRNQWSNLNQTLFNLQISRDSSDNIKDAEITRLNGVIMDLERQMEQFKSLLTECTTNASNLAKTGEKAAKKAKLTALWAKVGTGIAGVLAILLILHK